MTAAAEIFAVILAGGSGTRFWPASRHLRPKQLLPLGDGQQSLLAATVDRIVGTVREENILVATGAHLKEATRSELPRLPPEAFLAEPLAKNTAPCIGWAAQVARARNPEAIVIVLPSDQYAADQAEFQRVLARAVEEARQGRIATLGIVPTRPETGYGYIKKGPARGRRDVFQVDSFKEKPERERAVQYVESGDYLWNAGMFIFRAADMLEAFRTHLPAMTEGLERIGHELRVSGEAREESVRGFFEGVESISIDHGIMEKAGSLSVVAGDFGWTDLGSWESLWELLSKDERGNVVEDNDIVIDGQRNLVIDLRSRQARGAAAEPGASGERDPGRMAGVNALVGVSDLCVIQTDDGLLVIPRERSQEVRKVVQQLREHGREDLL